MYISSKKKLVKETWQIRKKIHSRRSLKRKVLIEILQTTRNDGTIIMFKLLQGC